MESRAHALAAGLFTLLLGAASALAVWWFADSREAVSTYELVSTGIISGLNEQANVRYRGMAAGKVTEIRIDPQDTRNILVTIKVRADLPVTRGTRASLGYQGVTGLAFIQLDDRGADPTPLESVRGQPPRLVLEPGMLDQITDTTMEALRRFGKLSDQVAEFFDEKSLARLRTSLAAIESAAAGIDRTFADAPETLAAIRGAFSPENLQRLSAALANVERLSNDASPTLDEMRALMTRLGKVVNTIDEQVRSTGDTFLDTTLPEVHRLVRELGTTTARIGRLVEEMEQTPQILITGRKKSAPGPGEPGFDPDHR